MALENEWKQLESEETQLKIEQPQGRRRPCLEVRSRKLQRNLQLTIQLSIQVLPFYCVGRES